MMLPTRALAQRQGTAEGVEQTEEAQATVTFPKVSGSLFSPTNIKEFSETDSKWGKKSITDVFSTSRKRILPRKHQLASTNREGISKVVDRCWKHDKLWDVSPTIFKILQ